MVAIIAGNRRIEIGRFQENEHRRLIFPVGDILKQYPSATFQVLNKRPQDQAAYPVPSAQLSVENGRLIWVLKAADLSYTGDGKCEVIAYSGEVVAKSVIYSVSVDASLDGSATPPEPWESWVEQVKEDADRAEAAAELLENPGAEAVTLEPGSEATASYSEGVFTFGIPAGVPGEQGQPGKDGKDGADGFSPVASVSKSGSTATITITDKTGTTTASVSDGATGAKGDKGDTGSPGADGFSPVASVSKSGAVATISITDKSGTTTASVTDGAAGAKGDKGDKGDTGEAGYTPIRGTDYWTAADKAEIVAEAESEFSEDISDIVEELSEQKSDLDSKAPVILRNASGDIVTVTDGADGMPLSACTVQVNPVQSGTGDPSPTNIRPITGVTTATLNRSNENLWDNSFYSPLTLITDPNDTYYGFYSGSIKSWAESYGPNFHKGQYGRISVTAEYGCYKDSGTGSFIFRVYFYYSDGSESYGSNISVDHGEKKIATRISDEGKTCISYIISTSAGATNNSGRIRNVMVAPYGAGYDFVEPNHQTYPITFPTEAGTVYGGTVDLAAKTLTVTDGQIASYAGETLPGAWISDRDVYTPGGTPTTGAQVVYKLATPLVYTLTDLPTITTLPGYNAIWSDTGAVAVTYPADTKTYVDDHTPVQDVQINGTSILSNGVANVPVATSSESGVVQAANWYGVEMNGTALRIFRALESDIKAGTHAYRPITPSLQQNSVFYALAKLAGADMASSSNPVGQYTDAAKDKIMKMIGILDMIAPYESTGVATRAYGVGDCFIQGGHLYRATASISIGVSFSASNCEQTTLMAEINR